MTSEAVPSQPALRRYLLGTASGAALIGGSPLAYADTPIDHIYIDAAGQFSFFDGQSTAWANPFFSAKQSLPIPFGPGEPRIGTKNGWDTFDDISLQSGNWYMTLAADYGRTAKNATADFLQTYNTKYRHREREGVAEAKENHTVVDFTVGKDVGLGMLGLDGSSIISGGIRYEHFQLHTAGAFAYSYSKFLGPSYSTEFVRSTNRQFVGGGPVISWKGRTPLCPDFSLAWNANAALLIGERSFEVNGVQIHHRGAVSPQFGGYGGISWQVPDSPFSLTAGIRGNAYLHIYDSGFAVGDMHASRYVYGPFLQGTWQVE